MVASDGADVRNVKSTIRDVPDIPGIEGQLQDIRMADANYDFPAPSAKSCSSHSLSFTRTTAAQSVSSSVKPLSPRPFDWTLELPDSQHAEFFKTTDWASTPLGPLESWGLALRLHTLTTFADSRPACLYWYDAEKGKFSRVGTF